MRRSAAEEMWGVSMLTHTVMAVDVGQLMADAGMTILIGLVVVFSVLILLTFIFWLFGKIAGGSSKKITVPKAAAAEPAAKPAPAPRPVPPTVQAGISEEIVAVIAAAVAAMEPDGKRYAVRSVSRARSQRPVWGMAGISENTRPF